MIIRFEDTEKNITYLRVKEGYSQVQISEECNKYYMEKEGRESVDPLTEIEYAIRQQLMILLTDEEVEELLKREKVIH